MEVSKSDITHIIIDGDAVLHKAIAKRKRWLYKDFDNSILVIDEEVPGADLCYMFLPVEESKKIVDGLMDNIVNEFPSYESLTVCFGGNNNFRLKIAKSKPYKGHRSAERPPFYQLIKEYMINKFECEIQDDLEADDMVGILNERLNNTSDFYHIICHIDKDLDMLPGYHYNIDKKRFYYISDKDSWGNFFKQVLTGDSGDNIPGLYRVGDKTSNMILKNCKTPEMMFKYVYQTYRTYLKGLHPKEIDEYFNEQCNLLWILRSNSSREGQYEEFLRLEVREAMNGK